MKIKELIEAEYAGARTLKSLLKFFVPADGDEFQGWEPGEFDETYGQYYRLRDNIIGKWGGDELVGLGIKELAFRGRRQGEQILISIFSEHSLIEQVYEKELAAIIQIFAKPKRLF